MKINELVVSSKSFKQSCYTRINSGYYQVSIYFNNIYSHFEIVHEELYLITAGLTYDYLVLYTILYFELSSKLQNLEMSFLCLVTWVL